MHERLRIVVIGAGAIGGWVGGRLALAGQSVTLVGRSRLADAVAAGGLCLRSPDGETAAHDLRVATSVAEAALYGPFDLAVFSVKTYDTAAALAEMQATDLGRPVILSLQNGVRSEELLAAVFGLERVVAGTILNPISTPQAGVVVLEKWKGGIGLAPVAPGASVSQWVHVFDKAVLPTRAYTDYRAMKWSKLLLNLIGNASAAILDTNSAEVYANRRLLRLEIEMLRETVQVMQRLRVKPVALPGYPLPWLAWGVRWAPWFLAGPVLRRMVAGGRGAKPPSLLLALRQDRRRSEIDDLNGAVVRAGEQVGLPTPVNRALTEIFARLTEGRIGWENVRQQPGVLLAVAEEMKRKFNLKASQAAR